MAFPNTILLKREAPRRGIDEMLSDFFREASVLIFVFGLLEPVFKGDDTTREWWYYVLIIGLTLWSFGIGWYFEKRRT